MVSVVDALWRRLGERLLRAVGGALSLVVALLLVLSAQASFAQTSVSNLASIQPPIGVTNVNSLPGCNTTTGLCTSTDTDSVSATTPTVAKLFTPSVIFTGQTTTLVLTFSNTHSFVGATLSATFSDVYPVGIVNAASPNISNSCGGVATANPGSNSVTLDIGAVIPAGGSCSVSVVVSALASGSYTNTVSPGALTTSVGVSAATATATLSASTIIDLAITKFQSTAREPLHKSA